MKIRFIFAWFDFWVGFFWDKSKRALYFFPIPMFGVRVNIWGKRCWLLRKRGYFYRPDAKGYTERLGEAGRYTKEEAILHADPFGDERVTMHHIADYL